MAFSLSQMHQTNFWMGSANGKAYTIVYAAMTASASYDGHIFKTTVVLSNGKSTVLEWEGRKSRGWGLGRGLCSSPEIKKILRRNNTFLCKIFAWFIILFQNIACWKNKLTVCRSQKIFLYKKMSKSGTPGIPVLEVENSPVLWKNPPFLQLSTITPITLAEAMLLDKRYHFIGISVKKCPYSLSWKTSSLLK